MSAYSQLPSAQIKPYAKVHVLEWQILASFNTPQQSASQVSSKRNENMCQYKDAEEYSWQLYSQSLKTGNSPDLHPGMNGSTAAPPIFAGLGMQGGAACSWWLPPQEAQGKRNFWCNRKNAPFRPTGFAEEGPPRPDAGICHPVVLHYAELPSSGGRKPSHMVPFQKMRNICPGLGHI